MNDSDACRRAFAAADAVVHLAAVPDPAASWETLMRPNVMGAYEVVQAAAVGDVCFRFFDQNGDLVDSPFNDRVVGITPDH